MNKCCEKIIQREIEGLCLMCEKDLWQLITDKKIRIHLCKKCRFKLLKKKVSQKGQLKK